MTFTELRDKGELPTETMATVQGPVDGNVFAVIGAVKRALQRAGKRDEATKFGQQVMQAESYDDVLAIAMSYVEFDI